MRIALGISAVFLLVCVMLGQNAAKPVLEFPASGSPQAHAEFIKGIIALHNSAYEDAADSFRAAEKLDPSIVMAYWGEALSFNHPFQAHEQRLEDAHTALAKLGSTRAARAAKAKTARERDYLNAVEDLYGDGDLETRDKRFSEDMHKVMLAYPTDTEAAAFYALSVLGTFEPGKDHTYTKQAAIIPILKKILLKYPDHPGALHYLIHCYDEPGHAQFGLEYARRYEKIASDVSSHALHMPSHIYIQLGLWQDVKRANQEAWAATEKHAKMHGVSGMNLDYHALQWLMYAELQLGQYKEARAIANLMLDSAKSFTNTADPKTRSEAGQMIGAAASLMFGPYAVETEQWDALQGLPVISRTANLLIAQGFAAAARKDVTAMTQILAALDHVAEANYSNGGQYEGARVDALSAELRARLALLQNHSADAERFASEALKFEDTVEFLSGPPDLPKPAHEFYGEVLLADNKPELAAAQFNIALKRTPKRALSLLGLARAQKRLKDTVGATKTYRELAEIWANADPTIPAVKEVRLSVGIN